MNEISLSRPEFLEYGPMRFAPKNELGVVFLFAHFAKRFGLKVDQIRPQFPDCIAYRKAGGHEKRVRIEFEYRSKNYKHPKRGCDMIVCWEHNWAGVPKNLEVIELRREFGLGFNVWVQPVGNEFKVELSKSSGRMWWSVPWNSHKGDLVLFYRNAPDKCIEDVFVIVSDQKERYKPTHNKRKVDFYTRLERVCRLGSPILLEFLRDDRVLGMAGFVRADMRSRANASELWPYLYRMILARNRSLRSKLVKYDPARL